MALLTVSALSPLHPPPPRCGASSHLQRAARPATRRRCCVDFLRRPRLRLSGSSVRRLDIFTSKCFATNIEIDCDNVVAEDPIMEIVNSCSVPVVHLKPDILDSNPIDLSSKGTGANHPLKKFHVLSKGEQDALAATPTHAAGLYGNNLKIVVLEYCKPIQKQVLALYAISLVGNSVEQLWSFVWPAAVATLHPNLLPVAVVGFCTKLAIFVGGPLVGKLMDYFPRVPAYHSLNLIQTAAQLLSAGMIIFALNTLSQSSSSSVLLQPWFLVLVVAGAIERLAGSAMGVTMERDWIVLLAGRNRPVALAQANSVLGRVDLLCEIVGASLFGILLSKYNPVTCLKLACCLTVCAQPVLFILGQVINSLSNGVLDHSRFPCVKPPGATPLFDSQKIVENGFEAFRHGWQEYKHQPVLPASLAYVLLYFNIALAPGAIMTSLLVHHGIRPSIIGGFSGLCSIMGFAATFMSASLVKRLGILKAGAAGLVFQAFLLTLAVSVYWTGAITQQAGLLFFLFLIVVSRLGHMSYDVVGTQILQTGVPTAKANLIGITEVSMASLAELLMFGVAIVANDVAHFGVLAFLSLSSVAVAALIFCLWLANPTESQRELFKVDTSF